MDEQSVRIQGTIQKRGRKYFHAMVDDPEDGQSSAKILINDLSDSLTPNAPFQLDVVVHLDPSKPAEKHVVSFFEPIQKKNPMADKINALKEDFVSNLQHGYYSKPLYAKIRDLGPEGEAVAESLKPMIRQFKNNKKQQAVNQIRYLAEKYAGHYSAREYIQQMRDLGETAEADRLAALHKEKIAYLLAGGR